jgi:hypothetical protein
MGTGVEPQEATTTEITRAAPPKSGAIAMGERGIHLATLDDAYRFAQYIVKSGLAPTSIKTAEQALIAMQAGAELGFSPMRSLSAITVINGRTSLMGDAALAKIRESGVCSLPPILRMEGANDERCGVVRFQRKDMPSPEEISFSIADAKRAGLLAKGGPWKEYTDDMLQWRAVGRMVKRYFGDVTMGLVVAEEMADYPRAAGERSAPPATPDPLLIAAAGVVDAEVINASSEELPTDESAVTDESLAWLHERADDALARIRAANTIVGEQSAWKSSEDLRFELHDKLPAREQEIKDAHVQRRRDLGAEE